MSPPVVRVAVVSVTAWRVTRPVCGCHVSRAVLGSLTITFPAIAWASLQLVSWEMVPSLPRSWPGPTLKRISCGPITNKNFYLHCSINRVFSAWKGGEDIKHADIVYTEVRSSQLWLTFCVVVMSSKDNMGRKTSQHSQPSFYAIDINLLVAISSEFMLRWSWTFGAIWMVVEESW